MKIFKNSRKLVTLTLVASMMLLCFTGCGSSENATGTSTEESSSQQTEQTEQSNGTGAIDDLKMYNQDEIMSGLHHVEIEVQDMGTISVELDADTAPITVTNFIELASEGFYDGLTFHRIIDGFMIQGGDPNGDGTGGSGECIKGEFSANDLENDISHVRGVISMARSSALDSASSQFFIVQEDSTYLDGEYAAFGHVTDGMDIVDSICENTPVEDTNGTVAAKNQPVITTIKVID